jgi:hypothetical protein
LSAISVCQNITLRKSIRKSIIEQSKLLDSIGAAVMEREVQKQVLTVAKKTSVAKVIILGSQNRVKFDSQTTSPMPFENLGIYSQGRIHNLAHSFAIKSCRPSGSSHYSPLESHLFSEHSKNVFQKKLQ